MTKSLKERKQELALREQALKEKLDLNSDEFKEKAKHVGKIALISGGVALLGFWIYKAFFEEDDIEKPTKKSKKRKKAVKGVSSRLATMALPYVGKILNSVFQDKEEEKAGKNKVSNED